ncbi:MAG TPA: gamma-glutamyltransferase [Thermomicrobiales bacterium]|nr:gamma-glutamyltransferase [Thermomicrobiales bacterium]
MLGFPNDSVTATWPERRPVPTYGQRGMIAAAHPLIVASGAEIQRQSGNAVDVAVACGLAAAVVMPEMCGLGGDLFAVIHDPRTGKTEAVMGSGISPRAATDEIMLRHGDTEHRLMPYQGSMSIAVPGMVDAYFRLLERWGTMSFAQVAAPSIDLARNGFAILPKGAEDLQENADLLAQDPAAAAVFLENGRPYGAGDRLVQGDLADTLETIAADGADTFYRGAIAKRMLAYLNDRGNLLSAKDFAEHTTEISSPLSTTYQGYTVHQTCLPTQGLILLEALNIVEKSEITDPLDPATIHTLVEAKKLAYADRLGYAADPRFRDVPLDRLLSKEWAQERFDAIDPEQAATEARHGEMHGGDTTYFATADGDGMMVSLIQSVSSAFGSGVVAGDTGVVMNNRVGRGFSLIPGHPNYFEPGKKTMHTLNCYLIDDPQGRPVLVGGTPGGDGQPQWNLQMITALVDAGMDVQQAVNMPRWTSWPGTDPITIANQFELRMEFRFDEATREEMKQRGHEVKVLGAWNGGGAAQMIARNPETGVMVGGSDSRVEGFALGR